MVKMINRLTGTEMYVDESRIMEYRCAGHTLVGGMKEVFKNAIVPEIPKTKRTKKKV